MVSAGGKGGAGGRGLGLTGVKDFSGSGQRRCPCLSGTQPGADYNRCRVAQSVGAWGCGLWMGWLVFEKPLPRELCTASCNGLTPGGEVPPEPAGLQGVKAP